MDRIEGSTHPARGNSWKCIHMYMDMNFILPCLFQGVYMVNTIIFKMCYFCQLRCMTKLSKHWKCIWVYHKHLRLILCSENQSRKHFCIFVKKFPICVSILSISITLLLLLTMSLLAFLCHTYAYSGLLTVSLIKGDAFTSRITSDTRIKVGFFFPGVKQSWF